MADTGEGISDSPRKDHPQAVSICPIDKKSVHRICSGQVVLTLATAVKELLENSIDAGATIVEIKLKDYGSESIEVSDNGAGVESCNFEGLTLKHHTSKLQDFGDLVNVETFGFRGEALSSLCALCDMFVTTRHKSSTVGTKLIFDNNGRITKQSAQARQVGTTVTLQNLFYTLPVRHKEFRRNLKKEFNKMVQVLNSYCIISTGVRISCTNQTGKGSKSVVVATNGNASLQENISSVFGSKQMQSLLDFVQKMPGEDLCSEFGVNNNQASMFRIDGYVSKCDHGRGRSSTDRQFFFINGRPFDSTKLAKVLNEVYHQYNRHQYPFAVLRITVEKESVDVNVTPDKRQVFLEREKNLLAIIKASLIAMYEPTTSVMQLQMPLTKMSSVKSAEDTEEDHCFTRISKHKSVEKPDGMSSLMKLKRSFSSAFAKEESSPQSSAKSPKKSNSPKKQRKLDTFVSTFIPAPEIHNSSQTMSSPSYEPQDDFVLVKHEDSDQSSGYLFIRGVESKVIGVSDSGNEHCEASNKDSQAMDEIDGTGDASCHSRVFSVGTVNETGRTKSEDSLDGTSNRLQFKPHHVQAKDEYSSSKGVAVTQHEVKNKVSFETSFTAYIPTDNATQNQPKKIKVDSEQEVSYGVMEMTKQAEEINSYDAVRISTELQDINSTVQTVKDPDCLIVDREEEREKVERTVPFSLRQLRNKLQSQRKHADSGQFSRAFRATITPGDNQAAEQELQKEIKKEMFSEMEILGQFNKGFIITLLGQDLFIVDQHATDEKYNFETLQRDTFIHSQKLICPQSLDLTASNEIILMDNLETFKKNGFEFHIDEEALPTQRVKLTSTPISKNWHFGKEDIEEMIFMLSDSPGVMCRPSRVRAMFASRACRKSIMIGTTLNKADMKKLVCHMGEIEQPWNCPHGRPTMRHLINLDMVPR